MPDEECVEEKKALALWKKVSIVTGALFGIMSILTVVYKLDSYNIRVYGDTVYAKDTELAREVAKDRIDLNNNYASAMPSWNDSMRSTGLIYFSWVRCVNNILTKMIYLVVRLWSIARLRRTMKSY